MTPDHMRTLRGPLLLRSEGEQGSTFDQRLLESGADHEWQHADPWRVLRIQGEFVAGFDALAKLPKAVTVFGSARTKPEDASYQMAEELGRKLAECAYAVITGGGPGIM
ncbi:TIGR00730 family Rossman fold protein, partial [Corallococcus sp. AB030]